MHLDNKKYEINIKKEDIFKNDNLIITLLGKGLPNPSDKNKNGNLYIRLLIEYPTFNEEQIDLLNTLFKYKDKEVISETNVTFSKYEKIFINSYEN